MATEQQAMLYHDGNQIGLSRAQEEALLLAECICYEPHLGMYLIDEDVSWVCIKDIMRDNK